MDVLEELRLIQFTLLPEEVLSFLDEDSGGPLWRQLLQDYGEDAAAIEASALPASPPRFQIKPQSSSTCFEVQFPGPDNPIPSISVNGASVTRSEQERWQEIIREKMDEIATSDFPVYQLLCLHLLPLLHEQTAESLEQQPKESAPSLRFHALFTSHHLISPKKRRSLQAWSSSLTITGFAKVGYPGVIYAQGEQNNVEEFVANVKAMQWLALRLRFLEPIPAGTVVEEAQAQGWTEVEKVGEVIDAMRRLGREEWIVEMGIGSRNS